MTRSQFILGVALLIVSGALAFTISFLQREKSPGNEAVLLQRNSASNRSALQTSSHRPSSIASTPHRPLHDRTHYDIGVSREEDWETAEQIEEESLQELDDLDLIYHFSLNQRREIFPLIAAKHPEFRDGMLVNGQAVSPLRGKPHYDDRHTSFEGALLPILTPTQQNELEYRILRRPQWWGHTGINLRDDLDHSIESGETLVDLVQEDPADSISDSQNPAKNGDETN